MNVLILGGNSPRHKEWIREVRNALEPVAEEVRIHDYSHWESGDPEADVEFEIDAARETAKDFGDYIIVAKSIGTVIATKAVAAGKLNPKACLFMGIPLVAIEEQYPELGKEYPVLPPTTLLQNTADPLGSSVDLQTYLELHSPVQYHLLTADGDTHDYVDFKRIAELAAGITKP